MGLLRSGLINYTVLIGLMPLSLRRFLASLFGNVDCTRLNWESKIEKINRIIAAWRHRELSYKGKALVINGLLASTLWYNATSIPIPT